MTPVVPSRFVKYLLTWTAGFVVGAGVVMLIAFPVQNKMLAGVTQMSDELQDIYSQGTILCEPNIVHFQADPGIPKETFQKFVIEAGVWAFVAWEHQPSNIQEQDCAARWYIPMKVQPVVYGDPKGAKIYHYNIQTSSWIGPQDPETIRK